MGQGGSRAAGLEAITVIQKDGAGSAAGYSGSSEQWSDSIGI